MRLPCLLSVAVVATACQASGSVTATSETALYKYAGSRQCERGGMAPEDARRALAAAGVEVKEASCGTDGRMYASVCGGADGRIVIVRVPASQASKARSQGFAPLQELPEAARAACR